MKSKLNFGIAAAGLSLVATTVLSTAAQAGSAEGAIEHRWVVDTQGRPPFKRQRVAVETIDLASMETVDANVATEVVWVRDTSGKPPFKRRRVEVPVVDIASMEVTDTDTRSTSFRGRPPFRRHR